jgi:hypothetical protein
MLKISGKVFGFSPRAKDVLRSVGGASAIFPVFAQLDQPMMPAEGSPISYQCDPLFLPSLIEVLVAFLRESTANQEEFASRNGFQMIGHLLARARSENITDNVLGFLKRLYREIIVRELASQMLEYIFLDFRLWIYLPVALQSHAYSLLLDLYTGSSDLQKLWFIAVLPFSRILHILKTFFWSVNSDPQICLLSAPKRDKVTGEADARPMDLRPLRQIFWKLAASVADRTFNGASVSLLLTLSFDQSDADLSVEFLTYLIRCLRTRHPVVLRFLNMHQVTFQHFFPLMASKSDLVRAQCIHIFALLDPELLQPYTQAEWITGIMSTMNTSGISPIFADVVYGYLFGLFDVRQHALIPSVRISQGGEGQAFAQIALLPLALLAIADFPDAVCCKYLEVVERATAGNPGLVFRLDDWDHIWAMFLIARAPGSAADVARRICASLYGAALIDGNAAVANLPLFVHLCAARSNRDFSPQLRLLLNDLLDRFARQIPRPMLARLSQIIFEYLFFLDEACTFFAPDFGARPANDAVVSFQALHRIKWAGIAPKVTFSYGTRTDVNGVWEDVELAERLIQVIDPAELPGYDPLVIFATVCANGLRHLVHFEQFEQYVSEFTKRAKGRRPDTVISAVLAVLGGLASAVFSGQPRALRLAHGLMAIFWDVIGQKIGFRGALPPAETISAEKHGVLHLVLERCANIDAGITKQAAAYEKETRSMLRTLARKNETFASRFDVLNITNSNLELKDRDRQIALQLTQFASSVRNKQREGRKAYKRLWRSLSSEGGPWCLSTSIPKWRIDETQLLNGRRGRLVTNYKFTDHKDASLLRDNGNAERAHEMYLEHLKELRMSEFRGDQSVITVGGDVDEQEDGSQDFVGETITLKVDANWVTMKRVHPGVLLLTRAYLIFQASNSPKHRQIDLSEITAIYTRRYLLTDTSIEVFVISGRSYFIDFVDCTQRAQMLAQLKTMKLLRCHFLQMDELDNAPLVARATKRWLNRKMSNFDYLMAINKLAGRTYNDLGQYPVFPWVISDYTSKSLDLDDPNTFRHLGLPIGAMDQKRLEQLLERLTITGPPEDRCLYNSFYSSAAVVIGFLIRMEPFASLHIVLQGGRFDRSSRLFRSIPSAWESVCTNSMDYRELIPEFFYAPDFRVNSNGFDLGKGVGDVELPPWASSPHDFVMKNRAALESPFVSAMLPRWIDMIFGVTSRGNEAESIHNSFSPFFYPEYMTPAVRANPEAFEFARQYAACFGQAPLQLFHQPHPSRTSRPREIGYFSPEPIVLFDSGSPVLSLECSQQSAIFVTQQFVLFQFAFETGVVTRAQLLRNAQITDAMRSMMKSLVQTAAGYVLTGAPWDTAFTLSDSKGFTLHIKRLHSQKLSAVALSTHFFATASFDCTVMLWKMRPDRPQVPYSIISKHKSYIQFLAICEECDTCLSCSHTGEIVATALTDGTFVRKIRMDVGEPTGLTIWPDGTSAVAFASSNRTVVAVFDQNLNAIAQTVVGSAIVAWAPVEWEDGRNYVVAALKSGRVVIRSLPAMEEVWANERVDFDVTKVAVSRKPWSIVLGTVCGKILKLPFDWK